MSRRTHILHCLFFRCSPPLFHAHAHAYARNSLASSVRRPVSSKKKSSSTTASADSPLYLDLNACLGRSQIERILARKKLPAPSTYFLTTFLRSLPKEMIARVHPHDLELFHSDAFREYEAKRKREGGDTSSSSVATPTPTPIDSTPADDLKSLMAFARASDLSYGVETTATNTDTTSTSTPSHTSPPRDTEEYYYLIKWKHRSYSPLSLHWIPHSLLILFHDGPQRIRRYERTREYGETRGTTRISKSDEELEDDEEKIIQVARGMQEHTLDKEKLKRQVEAKEEAIRAAQEALRPVQSTTLTSLLSNVAQPTANDRKSGQVAGATESSNTSNGPTSTTASTIEPSSSIPAPASVPSSLSTTNSLPSNPTNPSEPTNAAPSTSIPSSNGDSSSSATTVKSEPSTDSTPAAVTSDPSVTAPTDGDVHLTDQQLEELEHQLERNRIARRLADISNDHKLARFKKIKTGFFDADYTTVERIIGHQRRPSSRHAKQTRLYFSPETTRDHWAYFGLRHLHEIKSIEKAFARYVTQIDGETKKFMISMAETLEPRLKAAREQAEQVETKAQVKSEKSMPVATPNGPEDDDVVMKVEVKSEEIQQLAAPPPPPLESIVPMDEDEMEEKDQSFSKAEAAAAAAAATEASSSSLSSAPSSTVGPSSAPPASVPLSSTAPSQSSSQSQTLASTRSRRTVKRPKYEEYLQSDDDDDLKAILEASKVDVKSRKKTPSANNSSVDPPVYDPSPDIEERPRARSQTAEESDSAESVGAEDDADGEVEEDDEEDAHEEFEFLVKWTKLPYEACTWETRASLRRMDALRACVPHNASAQPAGPDSDDTNEAIPLPSLASLPFIPLSSLAFGNNLLLKYLNLPVIVDDPTHLQALGLEAARSEAEERQRESKGALSSDAIHHATTLHPTVPISSILNHRDGAVTAQAPSAGSSSSIASSNAQSPQQVTRSCMQALRQYLRLHSTQTRDASIIYPVNKKSSQSKNNSATTNGTEFHMSSAAVTAEMRFGPNQNMKLRPYQVDGINWLALNWAMGRNSILADEMGLGKTIQSCLLLDFLFSSPSPSSPRFAAPALVVAPLSTIGFWLRELERFTNLYGIVYRGTPESRKMIRGWDWKWGALEEMTELDRLRSEEGVDPNAIPEEFKLKTTGPVARREYKFNVMITSYEFILNDFSIFARIPFCAVIIDEAQRLKNHSSKLFERLSGLKVARKLLLTGTPIQNSMEELWSLLHFIEPTSFPSLPAFLAEFSSMNTLEQVTKLYHSLRPYVLRRLKSDVEKSLPPKEEILVECSLTRVQKKYYRAVYERNFKFLHRKSDGVRHTNSLINISMQLRKISQHPYLMEGCEHEELLALQKSLGGPTKQLTQDAIMEKLVSSSGKFLLLDKLLPKLKKEGHRVLIFSQMTRLLDILQDYCHYRRYKHERLDGNVGTAERQVAIDRFSQTNSDIFCFLLSTRAGGLGITLTAADTVIIFDSDWNLQNVRLPTHSARTCRTFC